MNMPESCKQDSFLWILTRNCEGTEQLQKENNTMEILSEFTICGKKYCTVRTKGGVSVVEKWEYNNVVNKYMRNGGNKK